MRTLLVVVVGSMFLASLAAGQTRPRFTEEKLKLIDLNLVRCLESHNPYIVCTALKTVREVKALAPEYSFSHEMTIALMRILKNENMNHHDAPGGVEEGCCSIRILAAVALNDMRSDMGDYAIKMQAKFTESKRLKRICSLLAYNRALEQQKIRPISEEAETGVAAK
jgi:hypothetical protein